MLPSGDVYNTYNIGPSTDPWGTPHRAPLLHDVAPFTLKGKKAGTKVCQRRTLAFHSNWQQFCLPKTSLRSLYYSLVYPCLTYCVSVWGSTYQSNLNRIIILQKKIIRIISKVSFDAHTGVLFKEQEILKFSDIYLYQIGKFMYQFKRGLLPNYFRDMFTLASQIHSHNTRNSSLFYIPHCRNNFRRFSIRFQGPKFFNSLSREIQNRESISLFVKRLKKYLLS